MDWGKWLERAQQIVEGKLLFKRFIDGTPLANDIAVWMADFAGEIAAAEREACAQILDTMVCDLNKGKLMPAPTKYPDTVRGAFAAAIRARSDAP